MPRLTATFAVLLLGAVACSPERGGDGAVSHALLEPYPKGRWRLASHEELERTVLFVSHLVIAHEHSSPGSTALRGVPYWQPDEALPARSEEAARELATVLARALERRPGRFAELARAHSDDAVSKELGGSLGGIKATRLPPEFLDALAGLRPGQTSRVVETAFGFHVLLRRPVPTEEQISARRILITHAGAYPFNLRHGAKRTRAEAAARAREVAAELRSAPQAFESLLQRYSDHRDVERGGDLGQWSTLSGSFLGRELELLAQLPVGGVTEPVAQPEGVAVLQRTANRTRPTYAAEHLAIPFEPQDAADGPSSLAHAQQLIEQLSAELAREPARFESLRATHCCAEPTRWQQGAAAVEVERLLETLPIGSLSPRPIASDGAIRILRRVDPALIAESPNVVFELPSPPRPQVERLIADGDGTQLGAALRTMSRELAHSAGLPERSLAALGEQLEALASTVEAEARPERRQQAYADTLAALRNALGEVEQARCVAAVERWVEGAMLGTR